MKSAKYKIWHLREKIKAKYLYLVKSLNPQADCKKSRKSV